MPQFVCSVCSAEFEVPKAALDKFAGWTPKYCREHSPAKRQAAAGSGKGTKRAPKKRAGSRTEENLTLAQVLEKYTEGPQAGVFTDGSSIPNPGPGGWGMVWVRDGEVLAQSHGESEDTTNNRMELSALIAAYRALPEDATETVYTDSRLCVDTITKWAPGWERRGWKRKDGEIKNLELVQELLALYRSHRGCKLVWIAAHSGNRWNEYADSLATAWMRDEL